MTRTVWFVLMGLMVVAACAPSGEQGGAPSRTMSAMNRAAEDFVKLVLAMGPHDPDYVDAYFGPEELKVAAKEELTDLVSIQKKAATVLADLGSMDVSQEEELARLRHRFLIRQLESLVSRAEMLEGRRFTFDEESQALYDAVAPTYPESHFQETLDRLGELLPGEGPLVERYESFRSEFLIPPDRLDEVFEAALDECRARTKPHIELPEEESFRIEYVTDKSWSGYNWYEGNYHSLIQVNTDLPIAIDRAVDIACHEGYPGHHVYNVLREKRLARDRGWVEFTVQPLFSPTQLIAEGSANYGIDVAFPGEERVVFERQVLFPLGGLDASQTELYYEVEDLMAKLSYAGNEAARRYLNGEIDAEQAAAWLARYDVKTLPRARQSIRFYDQYRSYVINYNLGKDMVGRFIERRGGTADHAEKRWEEFAALISEPWLPSELVE